MNTVKYYNEILDGILDQTSHVKATVRIYKSKDDDLLNNLRHVINMRLQKHAGNDLAKFYRGERTEYYSKLFQLLKIIDELKAEGAPVEVHTPLQGIFVDPARYQWVIDNIGKRLSSDGKWVGEVEELGTFCAALKFKGYLKDVPNTVLASMAIETFKAGTKAETLRTKISTHLKKMKNADPQAFTPFGFFKSTEKYGKVH